MKQSMRTRIFFILIGFSILLRAVSARADLAFTLTPSARSGAGVAGRDRARARHRLCRPGSPSLISRKVGWHCHAGGT